MQSGNLSFNGVGIDTKQVMVKPLNLHLNINPI